MNSSFSIKRVGLLIKRYFLEGQNTRVQLFTLGALIFIFTLQLTHLGLDIKQLLTLFGIVLTINQYNFFSLTNADGMHYLLIPASQFEKTIVAIILSNIYFFVSVIVIYLTVNLIGTTLSNLVLGIHNPICLDFLSQKGMLINEYNRITITKINIWDIFGKITILQTLIILAYLCFKAKSFRKYVIIFLVFGIWLCIVQPIIINFIINKINIIIDLFWNAKFHIKNYKMDDSFQITKILFYFILTSIMWVANYLLLRKKQIIN